MVFKEAFNFVPRESLWQVLDRRRMSGRILSSLRSIHEQDKACHFATECPKEMFECNIRMEQGFPASPLLFSLYPDELVALLEDASEHINCPRLAQLLFAVFMFADDIALFSYSPKGWQHQLDRTSVLHEVSR